MKPFTVVLPRIPEPEFGKTLLSLTSSDLVERVFIVSEKPAPIKVSGCSFLKADSLLSHQTLSLILAEARTEYLLLLQGPEPVSIEPDSLKRFLEKAVSSRADLLYSDFYEDGSEGQSLHPLIDYQMGSVRDDFDFGPVLLFSVPALLEISKRYPFLPGTQFAGLYDLRLKISIDHPVVRCQEPLYRVKKENNTLVGERIFDYVDPKNRNVQKEMETVFVDYLKAIEAYLSPHSLRGAEQTSEPFPMEASVVIPVRNRKETIAEAVKSALSQETDFPFNLIVVDNYSTDGTTALLSSLAKQSSSVRHVVPERLDLGIGGCWNEALRSPACGRYAVQLDSDDLYSSSHALQKMVDMLRPGNFAMVIGSYTLVDSSGREIHPGLIDHREWTDENGHNNALRINGLGAPRAFNTGLMRNIGFLDVSYGEDYAAALRICREYRIGRIYESLYLCRRWAGNTDAGLSIEASNRNHVFKDSLRTAEILARQKMLEARELE